MSPSTVSYVLSGARSISEATRERVNEAIRELGYTPNAAARSLAGAKSGLIALHIPVGYAGLNTTEFEYLTSVSQHALARGLHTLLLSIPTDDQEALVGLIGSQAVDGVLLMDVRLDDPRVPALQKAGIPFTLLGRSGDDDGITSVDDDFDARGAKAVHHLAELGHRRIAYLTQEAGYLDEGHGPAVRTLSALEKASAAQDIDLTVIHTDSSVNGGEEALDELMRQSPRPTALIGFNELALTGLVRSAATRGISVPEDLSVVGLSFPDVIAEILTPPITTVSPSPSGLASAAVDALTKVIAGADTGDVLLLQPELTVRGSTTAPPAGGA